MDLISWILMLCRFGPNVEKLECIRKHLETLNPSEQMQIPEVCPHQQSLQSSIMTVSMYPDIRNESYIFSGDAGITEF